MVTVHRRHKIDAHGALSPLEDACRMAGPDVVLVHGLLTFPRISFFAQDAWINRILRKTGIGVQHLLFAMRSLVTPRETCVIVREFSSIPLVVVFPLLLANRRKMFFVVNHNLQWAVQRSLERVALRTLSRLGCRLLFLEDVPCQLLAELRLTMPGCETLLHPVPETAHRRSQPGGVKRIGVIGHFRREKGIDFLLDHLKKLTPKFEVILGIPNPEDFRRSSRYGGDSWFRLMDTGPTESYAKMIASCDVLILNHTPEHYEFRASGVVADAAAAHVPVIVRDLTVLSHQISTPVTVGELFSDLGDIENAVDRVNEMLLGGNYDFERYNRARSSAALAHFFREICVGDESKQWK